MTDYSAYPPDLREFISEQRNEYFSLQSKRNEAVKQYADTLFRFTPTGPQPTPIPTNNQQSMAGLLKTAAIASQAVPDILGGFSNIIGSIGGVVNAANSNAIASKKLDLESKQFQEQLDQQNSMFSQSLRQNQQQFDARLNFQTTNMDRAWKTAHDMGLASPFQAQAPARINPTGSNDGFVNLGNYAQQMTFGN